MNLHNLTIVCSPDNEPELKQTFIWNFGDEVFGVECAIAKLQEWVDTRNALSKATSATKPLDVP